MTPGPHLLDTLAHSTGWHPLWIGCIWLALSIISAVPFSRLMRGASLQSREIDDAMEGGEC